EDDAALAYRAMHMLAQVPEKSVPFLKKHISPVANVDAKQMARLTKDLESDEFEVREKATEALKELGEAAEETLRQALKGEISEGSRARLQPLLDRLGPNSFKRLGELRGVEVLEHINSSKAREVLKSLAKGAAGAWLT